LSKLLLLPLLVQLLLLLSQMQLIQLLL